MRRVLLASTLLTMTTAMAHAQALQSGSVGGMSYDLLPASGGCSAATPCSVVTYLGYMDETSSATASDVKQYFGGAFAAANPHTIVIAPMITAPQDTATNWGGYNGVTSPQQAQMVAVVQAVEQTYGNTVNTHDSVVTGGSLGGDGTQAALIAYGPKGTVQPGVFSAGLSFDAATYAAAGNATDIQALCGVPLMAVHGTADTNQSIRYDQALQSALSSCGSFTLVPIQGAGHGTWGGSSGYAAGDGNGTPLGWLSSQLSSGAGNSPAATLPTTVSLQPTLETPSTSVPTPAAAGKAATTAGTETTSKTITSGSGSVTDSSGNVWTLSSSGSVQENGRWVAGGGGTSALTIENGIVYGQDAHGRGWFDFSTTRQQWIAVAAPPGVTKIPTNPPSAPSPLPPAPSGNGPCSGGGTSFGVFPATKGGVGQIYDPDQKPFFARGINVMEQDLNQAVGDATSLFRGINFFRLPIVNLDEDPSVYANAVQTLTSAGIVVEFEDHTTSTGSNAGGSSGVIFTGSLLAQEQRFYARFATYFKSNPRVWWGTNNEPPNGPTLSAWQLQTYQTIRGTGNLSPILLEINGDSDPNSFGQGYDPAAYAQMSNVIWDLHFYGWLTGYSTNQAANTSFLSAAVAQAQRITSAGGMKMPVIVGEYGNSTTGMSIDPNGSQAVQAVHQVAQSGGVAGTAAWAYGSGNPGDGLMNGGGLSTYGQQVASYIAQMASTGAGKAASCSAQNTATTANAATTLATGAINSDTPPTATAGSSMPAAGTVLPASVAAANQAAQQGIAAADALIGQADAGSSTQDTMQTQSQVKAADALLQQVLATIGGQ